MEGTRLETIYSCFLSKITDDMYMELDYSQTEGLLEELFINALPWFEFPRVDIYAYDLTAGEYAFNLTQEEINIIATYMKLEWLNQQIATVELVRMKYSGSDFKFTSQANHIAKLINLKKECEREGFHLQRLYKRRVAGADGRMRSTMGSLMRTSAAARANSVSKPSTPSTPSTPSGGGGSGGGGTDIGDWEEM